MTKEMLDRLCQAADRDAVILEVHIFLNWVIVNSKSYAMSTLLNGMPGLVEPHGMDTYMGHLIGRNALEIAGEFLNSRETLKRAVGMACLKSILPAPAHYAEGNAIDRNHEFAREHKTCFIGHFAEAENWRLQGFPVDIIELFPRPGDIHWDDSHEVLSNAELVLITGLTLVNDTFEEVVRRTPRARYRVIMGPTVPVSPVLFDFGLHQVGGTVIDDYAAILRYCCRGGGSIAHAPVGALRKINLLKDTENDQI